MGDLVVEGLSRVWLEVFCGGMDDVVFDFVQYNFLLDLIGTGSCCSVPKLRCPWSSFLGQRSCTVQ